MTENLPKNIKHELVMKEYDFCSNAISRNEKQVSTVRNWCITVLTAGVGTYFLYEIKNQMILLIPCVILFFGFNELFLHNRVWDSICTIWTIEVLGDKKEIGFFPQGSIETFKKFTIYTSNWSLFYGVLFFFYLILFLYHILKENLILSGCGICTLLSISVMLLIFIYFSVVYSNKKIIENREEFKKNVKSNANEKTSSYANTK